MMRHHRSRPADFPRFAEHNTGRYVTLPPNNSARTESPVATSPSTSTSYGYNARRNRQLSAGALSYAYDNEGQLANAGGTGLTFDYNHRLVGIGSDTQFSYDGRGNRLIATRAGVTTQYIYDPWGNLVADSDSNGVTHKYIYGKGLLAVVTSAGRYCYHFNGTGSTVAITDMTQAVVNSYAYDPFGQILGQQETVAQPFKYVGQYGVMAEPNGLYYMRARYYDPTVGRFISEDPIGFAGGTVNLYEYAQNNPVTRIDPSGQEFFLVGQDNILLGRPPAWVRPPSQEFVPPRVSVPRVTPDPIPRPVIEPPPQIIPDPEFPWWVHLLKLLSKAEAAVEQCKPHEPPSTPPLGSGDGPEPNYYLSPIHGWVPTTT